MRIPLLLTAPLLLLACAPTHDLPLPEGAFVVEDTRLSEMSGLEASPSTPDVFWSVNDSGSLTTLFRLGPRGEALGRVRVRGAWVRDAETLAIWREDGQPWLLIGDVGDNRGWRRSVAVHGLREPAADQTQARIAWTLRFRYPDGARDAEGIAVDHRTGELLVLSKREPSPRLYRVPLAARDSERPVLAEFVAELPSDALNGEVTGLDLTKDGLHLAVLTYRGLYVWSRHPGETWASVLQRMPVSLDLPPLRKAEAMAFDRHGESIFVGSERLPAHFLSLPFDRG